MKSLRGVGARYLRRRPGRYVLTGIGVALGVAVLFAVLLVSNTTTRALDELVDGFTGDADLVVTPAGAYDADLPEALEAQAAALPDVEAASGMLVTRTRLDTPTSEPVDPAFVYGIDLETAQRIRTFDLRSGRFASPGQNEIVLAAKAAEELAVDVGGTVMFATRSGRVELAVVGVLTNSGAGLVNGGNGGFIPLDSARTLEGKGAVYSEIDIALRPGTNVDDWLDANRRSLGEQYLIQDASELASEFRRFIEGVSGALLLVAAVAVFVGAFLIFLTFTVSVTERTRVYGTLRALGASPKQVRRVVITEALMLGAVASVAGLAVGYGLAAMSIGLVESLLDLDAPGFGVPVPTALVSVALGLAATVAASLIPARRAAAVGPVDAMRGELSRAEPPTRTWLAIGMIVAFGILGRLDVPLLLRALGSMGTLLGAVLLVPSILRPLAAALGGVTRRIANGVGDIAVLHLRKERSRSAYTLALIMVILASTLSLAASNRAMARSIDNVIEKQLGADIQLFAPGATDPAVADQLRAIEGVAAVTALRFGRTEVLYGDGRSRRANLLAVDPTTYFEVQSFAYRDGDDATTSRAFIAGGAVLLPSAIARDAAVGVGDHMTLRTAAGEREFAIVGTHSGLQEAVAVVGTGDGDALFGGGNPNGFVLRLADGADESVVLAAIAANILKDHSFEVLTLRDVKERAADQLAGFFGIAYAILLVTTVIGMLGLANTLAVSVIHRTREIGILRSAGGRRRQVRGMVLVEAATLVLVAHVLALPLGHLIGIVAVNGFGRTLEIDVA